MQMKSIKEGLQQRINSITNISCSIPDGFFGVEIRYAFTTDNSCEDVLVGINHCVNTSLT